MQRTAATAGGGVVPGRRVLVVDDSRVQRRILATQLARTGYHVTEAASAEEAIEIARTSAHDLVISDWVMNGMSGLDLCARLRHLANGSYVYFILLTSKTETSEIAQGLESGADDFLTKPVSGDELRARLSAGERILRMERELTDKNRQLTGALAELQRLYDSIDRDLIEARKLQQSLVRDRYRTYGGSEVSLLLQQSGHVGGDLVGAFPIDGHRIGLYAIDVSGHGITSALMTARLAGFLSATAPDQNIALVRGPRGAFAPRAPDDVASQLNSILLQELQSDTYVTLVYASVDLATGRVALVQAGHPHPAVLRHDGRVEWLGEGGLPIGLIETARFDTVATQLVPGDRLILMSDGMTEICDADGRQIDEDDLEEALRQCASLPGRDFLAAFLDRLSAHAPGDLPDDVSAVMLAFGGAGRPHHA